jgi:hypothetical protein
VDEPKQVTLVWEQMHNEGPIKPHFCIRAKVPGGWLVKTGSGITFVPDPEHRWK